MSRKQMGHKEERGSVLALIAAGIVALLGSAALAVDISYFWVVSNQLQNAVDAAALAGAQGLTIDPGNTSGSGLATQLAIQIAARNQAANQPITLSPNEITFPNNKTVRVDITRPAPTFFARAWGVRSVNIRAVAAAIVVPANSVGAIYGDGGMRPWAVFDQFGHGPICIGPNDADVNHPAHGPFNSEPHSWKVGTMTYTVQSDHYKSPYDSSLTSMDLSREADCSTVTGLIAPRDVSGQQVYLKDFKAGLTTWRTPGNFGPIALGERGSNAYYNNIVNGYAQDVSVGQALDTEPGNELMPTQEAVSQLLGRDPNAQLTRTSNGNWVVVSDRYPINDSPRVVPIPVYSVYYAPGNGRTDFGVANIVSFFVQGSNGREVWGVFVPSRSRKSEAGSPTTGSGSGGRMLSTVQLVTP